MSTIGAWCTHKLSFALGTYVACGRFGSIANNILLPYLYQITGKTSTGFFFGAGIGGLIFAYAIILVLVEKWSVSHGYFAVFF